MLTSLENSRFAVAKSAEKCRLADRDGKLFLDTLGEGCEKTGWILHAYVLMANHYHLLVETPEGNLAAGMK